MRQLDHLCSRLLARVAERKTLRVRARMLMGRPAAPERGLYIWGGVGRGKTHLVDTFYDSLALERKLRVHFHRFMQRVHAALTQHSGAKTRLRLSQMTSLMRPWCSALTSFSSVILAMP